MFRCGLLAITMLAVVACADSPPATTVASTTTTPPTTTSTTLQAVDVYARVAPGLAFVETPVGTGSAVLVTADLAVTNAHVVWPAGEVTVTFPGGEATVVPVTGYDWMADIAILDVSGVTTLPPPMIFQRATPEPGEPVFLVGYPADDTSTATPAITAGIVSRIRTWREADITLIQSDALISGGQSGGALVDDSGRIVGISGLSVGEGFALALASDDVLSRIDDIRAGIDPHQLGDRSVAALRGESTSEGSVPSVLDETVFVFDALAGDTVTIDVNSSAAANVDLVGPDGFVEASSDGPSTSTTLAADLVIDGVYFVVVYPDTSPIEQVSVAGVATRRWIDPDHDVRLAVGASIAGNGDYPGDLDPFLLDLVEGQTVVITASSINIDASLLVEGPDGTRIGDSDSAGGVIGFDATVEFTASTSGTYVVSVFDETGFGPGGYILTVEAA